MPKVEREMNKNGDFLVDYEEKVFPDFKAEPGKKALVTFHTIAFEGSISIVNTLSATRLLRKGYETSILLYGPGVTMGFQKGFPTLGDEAFPGHLFVNQRLTKFMDEGGKIYGCRFSTQGRSTGRRKRRSSRASSPSGRSTCWIRPPAKVTLRRAGRPIPRPPRQRTSPLKTAAA